MKLTAQIVLVLAILLAPFAVLAELKQPWDVGEDMAGFYQQWCTTNDLESKFFPAFSVEARGEVKNLMFEVMWIDFSDFLLRSQHPNTQKVVDRLSADNEQIDPQLTAMANDASSDHTRRQLIAAHNANSKHRENVMDGFEKLAMSDPQGQLAGALVTYLDCLMIRNVKSVDPVIAQRVSVIKKISIPEPQVVDAPKKMYSGHCSCADENVCFGERGGRYCLTSGGKRRYGI